MRYTEIVAEQEAPTDRFPITLSTLPQRQREWFLAAVQTAEAGKAAGAIPNVQFQDAKQAINRAFDIATGYEHRARTGWSYERFPNAYPELHTVLGLQKKLRADDNPHLVAFINEIAPLGTLFAELKGLIVKRQPKPVEQAKPGYHPPAVSTEAQARVVALLDRVTQETYEALRSHLQEYMRGKLTQYLEAQAAVADKQTLSPHDHFAGRNRRTKDYEAAHLVDRLTDHERSSRFLGGHIYTAKPEAELAPTIEGLATKEADEIRTAFVHKNYKKIASIIDAKGNYADGEIVGGGINLRGLDGSLRFRFADGSQFVVTNKVVYKVSFKGKPFLQFPLTFHDVVLPSGKLMPQPSEARMNTVFIQGG